MFVTNWSINVGIVEYSFVFEVFVHALIFDCFWFVDKVCMEVSAR